MLVINNQARNNLIIKYSILLQEYLISFRLFKYFY